MNHTDPRHRLTRAIGVVIALIFILQAVPASPVAAASTYYVATTGRDSNPGTASRPWRTLQHAANVVGAGATVLIRSGTYAGFVMKRSGTSSAPITFQRYGSETVTVAGGSATANVIKISGASHVIIRRVRVTGAAASVGGAGIRVENSASGVVLDRNIVYRNRSYGIAIVDSRYVTVTGNEIKNNAEGVYVQRAGQGVRVTRNTIHHQDRMVVATPGGHDDHGGVGVSLVRTTGKVVVERNRLWANRAVSPDWGFDGGAFEIYAASNALFRSNRLWNNRVVIETGSDGTSCNNNVFRRNVAYGATTRDVSKGMLFRCAENMLVAYNTFHDLDTFVFDLKEGGTSFATSIRGLRINNNIASMEGGKIYGVESALPSSVSVDYNLVWQRYGGTIGSKAGVGSTASLGTWRTWTGFDRHGINAAPEFVDAQGHDYHLKRRSPARDGGTWISGGGTQTSSPDMGRWEYSP
jgi:parallel beta-helix repeat protein